MNITTTATTEDGLTATRYAAIIDGTEAGYLLAHTSGLILNVEIEEDHQGEGIARALYEHADKTQGLYHVPAWGCTPEGLGFAEAMGGDIMDEQEAADILGLDLDQIRGSSPPTRGAHSATVLTSAGSRIIPAYAGSTRPDSCHIPSLPDHPRLRGEHHGSHTR